MLVLVVLVKEKKSEGRPSETVQRLGGLLDPVLDSTSKLDQPQGIPPSSQSSTNKPSSLLLSYCKVHPSSYPHPIFVPIPSTTTPSHPGPHLSRRQDQLPSSNTASLPISHPRPHPGGLTLNDCSEQMRKTALALSCVSAMVWILRCTDKTLGVLSLMSFRGLSLRRVTEPFLTFYIASSKGMAEAEDQPAQLP